MAKKTKPAPAVSAPPSRVTRYVAGSVLLAAWTLSVLSLISFDPADPPGHAVAPYNEHAANWIGIVGAFISYHAYLVLGPGVWVLMAGVLLYMITLATSKPVTQIVLRTIGVVIMAIMLSCLVNMTMPAFGSRPEGSGGLLAIFINHELLPRFNSTGTIIILGVSFWVGAIVTFDELVMAIPSLIARYAVKAFHAVPRFKVNMPAFANSGMLNRDSHEPALAVETSSVSAASIAAEETAAPATPAPIVTPVAPATATPSIPTALFAPPASAPDKIEQVIETGTVEKPLPVETPASITALSSTTPIVEPTIAMASIHSDPEVVTTISPIEQAPISIVPVPLMEEPIAPVPNHAEVIGVAHALHPTDPPNVQPDVPITSENAIADIAPPISHAISTPPSRPPIITEAGPHLVPQFPPMPRTDIDATPSRIAMLAMLPPGSPIPPAAPEPVTISSPYSMQTPVVHAVETRPAPAKYYEPLETTSTIPASAMPMSALSTMAHPPSPTDEGDSSSAIATTYTITPSPGPVTPLITADAVQDQLDAVDSVFPDGHGNSVLGEEHGADDEVEDAPAAYLAEKNILDNTAANQEALRSKVQQLQIHFQPPKPAPLPTAKVVDLSGYQFPGMELLVDPETTFNAEMEKIVRDQALLLESAMQQYRIDGEVVGIDSGPVITLYEIRLAPGTKVNSLSAVASDLARALKAPNVRIVPNMVGKDTVGVEVPNQVKERVRLKELITAYRNGEAKMTMPMFLGKDASGNPLVEDLAKMPHMLIAGTTGSGKSVCMNSIIMSFLMTKRPDELKLVLVDPKMVEMSQFRDIPHLMCPVVTEMNKAAAILEWAVTKMDERYELLVEAGVRDISSYNSLSWEELKERFNPASEAEEAKIPKKLYYMVFVIDELADLMMTNKEVEGFIVRIAQKARAVGMHLILATQRPQANVVTGLIKGNMPCRISMKVASGLDSRIVLDQKGAELLLGHGDMLFLSPRNSKLTRAQGTLVDDFELRRCVKFLKDVAQQSFEPQLVQIRAPGTAGEDSGERDELFDDAVRVVLETKRGSVSLLQRRLTIGYARASRLIEQMAVSGLLGEYKGSQAREVTISLEEWEEMKAQRDAEERESAFGKPSSAASATASAHSHPSDGHDDGAADDDGVPDEMDNEYRN